MELMSKKPTLRSLIGKIVQPVPSNGIFEKFLEVVQHWSYFTIYTGISAVIIFETKASLVLQIMLGYFILSYFVLLLRYSVLGFLAASENSTRAENLIVGATAISLPLIIVMLAVEYIKGLL
jgi:hypothetical protein